MQLHFPTDIVLTKQESDLYYTSAVIRDLVYELGVFAVGRAMEAPPVRPFRIWETTEGEPDKCLAAIMIDGTLVSFAEQHVGAGWEQ